MDSEPSVAKRALIPGAIAIIAAGLFLGWTFYSRQQAAAVLEHRIHQRDVEAARRFRQAYGSDDVKINGFTANPNPMPPGQQTLLCYGVLNAKAVRLDPPIEPVHPALSYCFNATFSKTTELKLIAEDAGGKAVVQTLRIQVQ